MRDAYPQRKDTRPMEVGGADLNELGANVAYLEEHGLVDAKWDGNRSVGKVQITAKGLDFLADDGGLSAILGVVTIRLHEDTRAPQGFSVAHRDLPFTAAPINLCLV